MTGKTCFFIGSRHAPSSIKEQLIKVVEQHIAEYGVTTFTVGHYGSFDSLVIGVLCEVKKTSYQYRIMFTSSVRLKPKERNSRGL